MADRSSNPRNENSTLYKKLTKLFSGPITNYRKQSARQLRKKNQDKWKNKFKSVTGQSFKKEQNNPFQYLHHEKMMNRNRAERYIDFEQMEYDPLISSALDIYADEMTTSTSLRRSVEVSCENEEIREILKNLYYDIINVDYNLFGWSRTMCKYGDYFLYLDIDKDLGITNTIALPVDEMERLEGEDETNPNYVQFQWNSRGLTFENWQVAHFRNIGQDKYSPYGTCLAKDTRVSTPEGPKEIQDIEKGDIVFSFDEEEKEKVETEVKDKVCNGTKDIINIQTDHNYIEATADHRVLTYDVGENEYEYKFASNLTLNDNLVVKGANCDSGTKIEIDKSKPNSNKNGYWNSVNNIPDYVTKDFARLFGFLVGDGWIPTHNDKVEFAHGEHKHINDKYSSLLNKFSGKEVYTREHKKDDVERIISHHVNSKMFTTVLKRMGFEGTAYSKRIPKWVYRATKEVREAFLDGLVDADGSTHRDKWGCVRYQLELTNEQLIKDAKYLVQSLGRKSDKIMSRKREDVIIEGRSAKANRSYYFYFYDSKNTQMKKYKPSGYESDNEEYIIEPIRSIEETGEDTVYDIHVEGNKKKYNNFYANGIVVHNSVLEPARRIWRQLCLHGSSRVMTNAGSKQIKDIESGDIVYAFDPEESKTKSTKVKSCKNMGEQDVYKVRTRNKEVEATLKHGLLVFDDRKNGGYSYKKVSEIKEHVDSRTRSRLKLVSPVVQEGKESHVVKMGSEKYRVKLLEEPKYESKGIMNEIKQIDSDDSKKNLHHFLKCGRKASYDDFKKLQEAGNGIEFGEYEVHAHGTKTKVDVNKDLEFEVGSEFCRFFGFMLGDGWAYTENNRVGFALGEDDKQNDSYEKVLRERFNGGFNHQEPDDGRGGKVELSSAESVRIMKELGFISDSANKIVPEWIYQMNLECRREFVRGYFDADGGYSDGRVTSINEELLEGIQTLCYMSGIPCNEIKQDREAETRQFTDGEGECKASYRMYINMNEEKWCDDYEHQRIQEVMLTEENAETYDLQVEDDLHNFVVEGIVSHNTMLEDAVMAYRIVRSPERKVFYIDVGGIPPEDVEDHVEDVVTHFKRHQVIDEGTHTGGQEGPGGGRVDLRYNPMSIEEDYYIPVRGEQSNTHIEKLQGGDYTGDIDDIQYLQDKLLAALKVPHSYLVRGEGASADKTTLAQKDVRFARTIQRLQRILIQELEKIGVIHLYTLGFRGEDLADFKVSLNNPSRISELQELEHLRTKFDIANSVPDNMASDWWIADNILGMSEEEFIRNRREIASDKKFEQEIESLGEGEFEEGLGGDIEGGFDETLGDEEEDLGDEEFGTEEEPFGGEDEDEEEGGILAAPEEEPGKRDDEEEGYLTPGAKGKKYTPEKDDKRDMGARKRSYKSKYGDEQKGSSKRSKIPGYGDIFGLSNGIYENFEEKKKQVKRAMAEEDIQSVDSDVNRVIKRQALGDHTAGKTKDDMTDMEKELSSTKQQLLESMENIEEEVKDELNEESEDEEETQ